MLLGVLVYLVQCVAVGADGGGHAGADVGGDHAEALLGVAQGGYFLLIFFMKTDLSAAVTHLSHCFEYRSLLASSTKVLPLKTAAG